MEVSKNIEYWVEGTELWNPKIKKEWGKIQKLVIEEVTNRKIDHHKSQISRELKKFIRAEVDKVKSKEEYETLFGNDYNHKEYIGAISILSDIQRKSLYAYEIEYRIDKLLECIDYYVDPDDRNTEEDIEMTITFPRYERNIHEFRMVEKMFKENDSEAWERAEKFKQKHKERVKSELIETEPSKFQIKIREIEDKKMKAEKIGQDYFANRSRLFASYIQGNYPSHTPEEGKIGMEYEDDYFTHLSNPESEDEMEICSENFRKTEELLEQIELQKSSSEPKHTEIIENSPIVTVENVKTPQNKPTNVVKPPSSLYPVTIITENPILEKPKSVHKRVKPPTRLHSKIINQFDGPTDTSDGYTSRSDDENNQDLSMSKKNKQIKRNAKRRKTSRTKEEIEIDQEERKEMLERMEEEKTELAIQKNAQKPKPTKKDKNKEKVPYQEQVEQPLQEKSSVTNGKATIGRAVGQACVWIPGDSPKVLKRIIKQSSGDGSDESGTIGFSGHSKKVESTRRI
ncbi:hypothetical protein JTB14_010237 [Gonioctena quinquepunctata]|nr:hypothetical protein JTB14_010237 [Gonioctena quinquepunctata]